MFIKNLKIQVKKQDSNQVTDLKTIVSFEYHDLLNVFFKKKADILSSRRKHDHRIELKKTENQIMNPHRYTICQKTNYDWTTNI